LIGSNTPSTAINAAAAADHSRLIVEPARDDSACPPGFGGSPAGACPSIPDMTPGFSAAHLTWDRLLLV